MARKMNVHPISKAEKRLCVFFESSRFDMMMVMIPKIRFVMAATGASDSCTMSEWSGYASMKQSPVSPSNTHVRSPSVFSSEGPHGARLLG